MITAMMIIVFMTVLMIMVMPMSVDVDDHVDDDRGHYDDYVGGSSAFDGFDADNVDDHDENATGNKDVMLMTMSMMMMMMVMIRMTVMMMMMMMMMVMMMMMIMIMMVMMVMMMRMMMMMMMMMRRRRRRRVAMTMTTTATATTTTTMMIMVVILTLMIWMNEAAQASQAVSCTSEPKSRAHTRRLPPQNCNCSVLSKVSTPRDAEPWAVAFSALWLERTASLARALALHGDNEQDGSRCSGSPIVCIWFKLTHTSGRWGSTKIIKWHRYPESLYCFFNALKCKIV